MNLSFTRVFLFTRKEKWRRLHSCSKWCIKITFSKCLKQIFFGFYAQQLSLYWLRWEAIKMWWYSKIEKLFFPFAFVKSEILINLSFFTIINCHRAKKTHYLLHFGSSLKFGHICFKRYFYNNENCLPFSNILCVLEIFA